MKACSLGMFSEFFFSIEGKNSDKIDNFTRFSLNEPFEFVSFVRIYETTKRQNSPP